MALVSRCIQRRYLKPNLALRSWTSKVPEVLLPQSFYLSIGKDHLSALCTLHIKAPCKETNHLIKLFVQLVPCLETVGAFKRPRDHRFGREFLTAPAIGMVSESVWLRVPHLQQGVGRGREPPMWSCMNESALRSANFS